MYVETLSQSFSKARSVNQTSTSFVSKIATTTTPAADSGSATASAAIDMIRPLSNSTMLICPYGTGADNDTFSVRIIGWRSIGEDVPGTMLWLPIPIAELLCTLSSAVGVSAKIIVNTERFADTIALTYGTAGILSNGVNLLAMASVGLAGFQKIELSFSTGGVATNANAAICLL